MSYSFGVRASTKAQVMAKVIDELDKVVRSQPVHAADRAQAKAAVDSFLDVVPNPSEDQELSVSVSGSVSWNGVDQSVLTSAGVNVSVSLVAKQT